MCQSNGWNFKNVALGVRSLRESDEDWEGMNVELELIELKLDKDKFRLVDKVEKTVLNLYVYQVTQAGVRVPVKSQTKQEFEIEMAAEFE